MEIHSRKTDEKMDNFLQTITDSVGEQLHGMNSTIVKMKEEDDRYKQISEIIMNMAGATWRHSGMCFAISLPAAVGGAAACGGQTVSIRVVVEDFSFQCCGDRNGVAQELNLLDVKLTQAGCDTKKSKVPSYAVSVLVKFAGATGAAGRAGDKGGA